MANVIGYDEVAVSQKVVEPNDSATKHAARCVLFYLDPRAEGLVRWRADRDPTQDFGLPIYPGSSVVLAGPGNIRDSKFISGDSGTHRLYVVYFDNVDMVAMNFQNGVAGASSSNLSDDQVRRLDEMLLELKRIRIGTSLIVDHDLARES